MVCLKANLVRIAKGKKRPSADRLFQTELCFGGLLDELVEFAAYQHLDSVSFPLQHQDPGTRNQELETRN